MLLPPHTGATTMLNSNDVQVTKKPLLEQIENAAWLLNEFMDKFADRQYNELDTYAIEMSALSTFADYYGHLPGGKSLENEGADKAPEERIHKILTNTEIPHPGVKRRLGQLTEQTSAQAEMSKDEIQTELKSIATKVESIEMTAIKENIETELTRLHLTSAPYFQGMKEATIHTVCQLIQSKLKIREIEIEAEEGGGYLLDDIGRYGASDFAHEQRLYEQAPKFTMPLVTVKAGKNDSDKGLWICVFDAPINDTITDASVVVGDNTIDYTDLNNCLECLPLDQQVDNQANIDNSNQEEGIIQ